MKLIETPPNGFPFLQRAPYHSGFLITGLLLMITSNSTWADCVATSGATPVADSLGQKTLTPANADQIDCTTNSDAFTISNASAEGVVVNVDPGLSIKGVQVSPTIILSKDTTINNDGTLLSDQAGSAYSNFGGTITVNGTGITINNSATGVIAATDGFAIQGALNNSTFSPANGLTLVNAGTIENSSISEIRSFGLVAVANDATVTNTSTGLMLMSASGSTSLLQSGNNLTFVNDGTIFASNDYYVAPSGTISLSSGSFSAVVTGSNSSITNNGSIGIDGSFLEPENSSVIQVTGTGTSVVNTGLIDASAGGTGVLAQQAITLTNSGTISGSSGHFAINIIKGDGSVVTLQTGSVLNGDVSVSGSSLVKKTLEDFNGNQQVFDLCKTSTSRACFKAVIGAPALATLRLEGTGTEDSHFSGFNLIEKTDAGAWTLDSDFTAGSASDAYTTGDYHDALTLDIQDAAGQLTLTGNLTDNADGTAGALVKNGTGLLILSGTNTYSGTTTIHDGTLLANGGSAIGDLSAVNIAHDGIFQLGANETIGILAGSGTVDLAGNSLTMNANIDSEFGGALSGNGNISQNGNGKLTLTSDSTATGTYNLNSGSLVVNAALPMDLIVAAVGTIKGSGELSGLTNAGKLAPGNSIGTLTVNGNYTQTSSGVLEIEIDPNGAISNDLVDVSGAATLAGTLIVKGENDASLRPVVDGNSYTILTAGGGVTGQFDTVQQLAAFQFTPTYNANDVELGVTYVGFRDSTKKPNIKTGAATLNQATITAGAFNTGNTDLDNVLSQLAVLTLPEYFAAVDTIVAEPYAAFNTVLLEQSDYFADTIFGRAQSCNASGIGFVAGAADPENQAASSTQTASTCAQASGASGHGLWVDISSVGGNVDSGENLSGYDYTISGLVIGTDRAFSNDIYAGVAFGIGNAELDDYDFADAQIDGDSYFLGAYANKAQGRWGFSGLLGWGKGEYDSTRHIRFATENRQANGSFDGDSLVLAARATYALTEGNFEVVPEAGITYSKINQDGFTETGADSLNLKVEDADAHSVVTSLGVSVATEYQLGSTKTRPVLSLRYEHDWNAGSDNAHEVDASLAQAPALGSMNMVGRNRGEDGLSLDAGASIEVRQNLRVFAGVGYRWDSHGDEQKFGASATYYW